MVDASLKDPRRLGELHARVHAERLERVLCRQRGDEQALGLEDGDHVREVVLALSVLRAQAVEMREEHGGVEAVGARVDLVDSPLLGRAVLLLDDLLDLAVAVAHDPAVAVRVGQVCREHRDRGTARLASREEACDGLGGHERRVAREHDERSLDARQRLTRAHDRVTGTELLVLANAGDALDEGLDGRGAVPRDRDHPLAARRASSFDDQPDHGNTQDRVGDLGCVGLHAGPLAGGEDEGCCAHGGLPL